MLSVGYRSSCPIVAWPLPGRAWNLSRNDGGKRIGLRNPESPESSETPNHYGPTSSEDPTTGAFSTRKSIHISSPGVQVWLTWIAACEMSFCFSFTSRHWGILNSAIICFAQCRHLLLHIQEGAPHHHLKGCWSRAMEPIQKRVRLSVSWKLMQASTFDNVSQCSQSVGETGSICLW